MSGIVDTITSVLGTILYPLFSVIFLFIDGIQHVFYAFAGIGNMWFDGKPIGAENTGAENDTGIVYHLMNNSLVKNMLMSIMLLGLFLVIIFTVMAFIKNAYAAKQKGWKEIIGNAIKGLANFIFLPVCCLLGVWLGNILLNAINGATSAGGSTNISRKLFIACSYNANRYRLEDNMNAVGDRSIALSAYIEAYPDRGDAETQVPEGLTNEQYALIIDELYAESADNNLNIHWYWKVGTHYSLWQINYLILIVGGIFMLYALGSLSFGMIRRLFLLLILFIISPGVCAMYPLDEGKAVGSWKGEFIKQVLSVYGAVAGLNIFFSLLPLIDKINLFGASNLSGFGLNDIIHLFILVSGLFVVKEITGLISGFVGGEDAYGKSTGMIKQTTGKIAKTAVAGAGVFAIAKAASHNEKGFWSKTKAFSGSLTNQAWGGMKKMSGLDFGAVRKQYKDKVKEGEAEKSKKAAEKAFSSEYDPTVKTQGIKKLYNNITHKKPKRIDDARFVTDSGDINFKHINEVLEHASFAGVAEDKVYGMIVSRLKNAGIKKENGKDFDEYSLKEAKAKYDKEQAINKAERQAAYAAHGKEFEAHLDNAIVNIKAQETKVESAQANFDSAKLAKDNAMAGLTDFINMQNGKGTGKSSLLTMMRNKVERGDITAITEAEMDAHHMSNTVKSVAEKFNKMLEEAGQKVADYNAANSALVNEQNTQKANLAKLDGVINEVTSEFASVKDVVSKLGGVADKTSDQLENIVKAIKTDIRH